MKPLAAMIVALAALAPAAGAQFSLFPWTQTNSSGGFGSVSATGMALFGSGAGVGGVIKYTSFSHVAGRVTVHAHVMPEDGVCTHDGQPASIASYIVNGQFQSYATCFFDGTLTFDVVEGQTFGFGLKTNYPSFPYDTIYSDLTFAPYWLPLGGALAGSAGTPAMTGLGVLQPGQPMSLALAGAAPNAAAALFVGLGTANLPFKGGVLVPTPDIIVQGLVTNGSGAMTLATTWPAGITQSVVMQAWIADAGGPKGFAASNAVKTLVP